MMRITNLQVLAAVVLLAFVAGCSGQATLVGPPSDGHKPLSASTKNLSYGDQVRVVLKSGEEIDGTICRFSRDWIVLQTGICADAQEREIFGEEILYIYGRKPSIGNTMAAVVLVGLASSLIGLRLLVAASSD